MTKKFNTVFFDLDGTLADTAPDLGGALNTLLVERGRAPLLQETIRPVASHGSPGLIKLGFGLTAKDPDYDGLRARFLDIYRDNLCKHTEFFPGIAEVLKELGQRGIKWGVVTNKPAFLTEPLLKTLNPSPPPACIVS